VASEAPIGPATIVVRDDEPVAVEMDRTVVMMSLSQGMYFGLEGVGPRIWALLERPRSVAEVCAALVEEFEVDESECQRDVCEFLEELRRSRLVKIHDPSAPAVRSSDPA
jgi:hypothetical protein